MNINSVKFKETHFPLLCKFSRQEVGSWVDIYTLPAYVDRLGGWVGAGYLGLWQEVA